MYLSKHFFNGVWKQVEGCNVWTVWSWSCDCNLVK